MSSDLYNKIVADRGSIENLLARIPSFRGYIEKQDRRQADMMLREYITKQLEQRIQRMVQIEKMILDNGGMAYMSRTRDVKGRIQHYKDRVSTAAPGYSGMFDSMKIGEDELELIYTFDEAQIRYVDKLDMALEKLQQAAMENEGLEAAIMALNQVATEAHEAFTLRDDLLTNLGNI